MFPAPVITEFIAVTSRKYSLQISNVFHAGDGNIHPLILYDKRDSDQVNRDLANPWTSRIELGGSVSDEHSIGVEKVHFMGKQFSEADLKAPEGILSTPGPAEFAIGPPKPEPTLLWDQACAEAPRA